MTLVDAARPAGTFAAEDGPEALSQDRDGALLASSLNTTTELLPGSLVLVSTNTPRSCSPATARHLE